MSPDKAAIAIRKKNNEKVLQDYTGADR